MSDHSLLKKSKNWILFRGLLAASRIGQSLSLPAARRHGARLGLLAYRLLARERAKTFRSLETAFPELGPEARESLARSVFQHLGVSLMEICWLPNLDQSNLIETTEIVGLDNLRVAVDGGKGVVLFTGHCGNWEWMASAIGLSGLPMNVIAREIYDPRINGFIVESRARHEIRTIGRGSTASAREMLQTLRKGAILGVLIDQNIKAENVQVPFFGLPAATPVGPARLAIRAGAMAIAGFIERRGGRQVIHFEAPLATSKNDDPGALTAMMTGAIEEQIRRVPEQWVWMHDRWKVR